jgi:hypothetical protein
LVVLVRHAEALAHSAEALAESAGRGVQGVHVRAAGVLGEAEARLIRLAAHVRSNVADLVGRSAPHDALRNASSGAVHVAGAGRGHR